MKPLGILCVFILFITSSLAQNELTAIDPDSDNIIVMTQYNYHSILDYVKSMNGTLILHGTHNICAPCIPINKNLRSIAKEIGKDPVLKNKYFISICNLSENRPLESKYFLGVFPKLYYFTAFENMRKRVYDNLTTPSVIMNFFKTLAPKEPETLENEAQFRKEVHLKDTHLIIGIFPNKSDEIYKTKFIEMSNKFSHIPVFACFPPQNVSYLFNVTDNDSNVIIYRKPELRLHNEPEFILWSKKIDLIEFIEAKYHMDVDIYTHDSKYLYDLHSDDVGMIYYSGANTLYHDSFNSPVSKLIKVLGEIHTRLQEKQSEFVTDASKNRYSRFTLALSFKQEFWFLSQRLGLKMAIDHAEEFTPIIVDNKQKLYMDPALKYMTMGNLDVDKIFQFFYDYILGNLEEYLESESIEESYVVDKNWRRRLNQTEASSSISTLPGQVEIKRIVAGNFRKEVEESGIEILLILTNDEIDFCERFVNQMIINEFAPTVMYSPNFKILVMDGFKNDMPEEYPLYTFPQVMLSLKEKNNYTPIIWRDDEDFEIKNLRVFLHKYSKVFPTIDKLLMKK